jgi:hypothetical protein
MEVSFTRGMYLVLADFQRPYIRSLVAAFLTYPTESVVTRFAQDTCAVALYNKMFTSV